MKKNILLFPLSMFVATLMFSSCSTPVGLTSWKNPEVQGTVSKIVVLAVFDKMSTVEPLENQCKTYFSGKNLPTIKSMDIMNPFRQYSKEELKQKLDSVGADGLLLLTFKGKDVDVSVTPGFYGGYRGYWGGGSNVYVDNTYNLRAMLYTIKTDGLLWSGDLSVTNPNDVTSAAQQIAPAIFNDWVAKGLLKNPPPPSGK